MEKATFGAGCFWSVEAEFREIPGIIDAVVGFAGGSTVNPTYRDVCAGDTGHAEVCEVTFDPSIVSYDRLLDAFWQMHDPTTRDRQGPDFGSQYRSVIFFHTPEQHAASVSSKAALEASGRFKRPIVTEISPAGPFYPAEEYHQRYLEKQGRVGRH